jgi:hypothetical protein
MKPKDMKDIDESKENFRINSFCTWADISRPYYYKLRSKGLGPRERKLDNITIITGPDAIEWRDNLPVRESAGT